MPSQYQYSHISVIYYEPCIIPEVYSVVEQYTYGTFATSGQLSIYLKKILSAGGTRQHISPKRLHKSIILHSKEGPGVAVVVKALRY